MNPRSRRSRFRLSWSRRRVSAPGIPQNGARRFCIPNLRRVVQRLRFSIRKSSELFRNTPLHNVMMNVFLGFSDIFRPVSPLITWKGRVYTASDHQGAMLTFQHQCVDFSCNCFFFFFYVCLMTQAPAFILLVGRGSDLCLLKT